MTVLTLACAPVDASGYAPPLAGTAWRPVLLSGLDGAPSRPVYVKFSGGGRVSGFSGCNRFSGSYRQSGNTLEIGPLTMTRMACAANVMKRESRFVELLGRVQRVDVGRRELAFKTWQGAVFLRLVPHE